MTCKEIMGYLDDYLDGTLSGDQQVIFSQHLGTCKQCQEGLSKEQEFRQNLKDLPVFPLSPAFSQKVFMAAAQQEKRDFHRRSFITGFGSAIAASLALWLVTVAYFSSVPPTSVDVLPTVAISVQEVRKVKLVFDATHALHQAKVSIYLPESVELVGFPGQRVVSWQANLGQGKNLLSLPLRALQEQTGALEAHIEHDGKIKVMRLKFAVEKPGMSGYSKPQLPMV